MTKKSMRDWVNQRDTFYKMSQDYETYITYAVSLFFTLIKFLLIGFVFGGVLGYLGGCLLTYLAINLL